MVLFNMTSLALFVSGAILIIALIPALFSKVFKRIVAIAFYAMCVSLGAWLAVLVFIALGIVRP